MRLMYYAPHIFTMAGADKDSALLQSVVVGGTNLVFTMLALLVIDHFGRRRLMLVGSIGYILSLGSTAFAFYRYGDRFQAVMDAVRSVAAAKTAVAEQGTAAAEQVLATAQTTLAQASSGGRTRRHDRPGQFDGVHRLARIRSRGGDLGVHQRDLSQPRAGPRPGVGQLHALGDGRRDLLDVSDVRRGVGRSYICVLCRHDGPATRCGCWPSCRKPKGFPWKTFKRNLESNDTASSALSRYWRSTLGSAAHWPAAGWSAGQFRLPRACVGRGGADHFGRGWRSAGPPDSRSACVRSALRPSSSRPSPNRRAPYRCKLDSARQPQFTIHEHVAWDAMALDNAACNAWAAPTPSASAHWRSAVSRRARPCVRW